ncbi:MAG TPA: PAS domain-containing protein, partial [Candidatus Acidoferrum sp.]|nr:PAS domain-containing protein [Candidatus Acidoferrum sp.]
MRPSVETIAAIRAARPWVLALVIAIVGAVLYLGIRPGAGAVVVVVGTVLAVVTARRRIAAERVAEIRNEALVRSLVQTATDATVVIDRDGLIRFASPSVETTLGHDPEFLIGTPFQALLSVSDASAILAMHRDVVPGGNQRIESVVSHPDGRSLTL